MAIVVVVVVIAVVVVCIVAWSWTSGHGTIGTSIIVVDQENAGATVCTDGDEFVM